MIIRQLKSPVGDNFTYVIGCETTGEALVIDPFMPVDDILKAARSMSCRISIIVNTHGHRDHTAGNAELKKRTGARTMMHSADAAAGVTADHDLDQEKILKLGSISFQIIHTPGHTPGGICLHANGHLFTGDTLFVGDSGRTDLPGGNRPLLGASIRQLMELDGNTIVWPGHDYGPTTSSTLDWEKRHNVNAREYGFYLGDQ